ncbi:MAG: diadenylate cyclase CdaA [Acidobacteriota bacterium]
MQEVLWALYMRGLHWQDVLDVLAVAALFYFVLRQVRGTRAVQMMVGILALLAANAVSGWLDMTATHRLLQNLLFYVPFAAVVIFQDTIRKTLAHFGGLFFGRRASSEKVQMLARETAHAAFAMAQQRHGALVVFERTQGLKDYAETGIPLKAQLTADLLQTLFFPGTLLHDGAVVVSEGEAVAAGCTLPLTETPLPTELGTRHRAAAGITEETDAICVVVSEERGVVSLVEGGRIDRVPSAEELALRLEAALGGRSVDR